ncbi:MAG: DUF167 domain-containing protein [Candidatus Azambacteria bacterium]|nr:DUF167 domain-containing protein [Candidatus Azambacteria bacterium]
MKFFLSVKPKSSKARIEQGSENELTVWVREVPEDGKANDAVVRAVAEYCDVAPSRVKILRGATGRKKVVEIL